MTSPLIKHSCYRILMISFKVCLAKWDMLEFLLIMMIGNTTDDIRTWNETKTAFCSISSLTKTEAETTCRTLVTRKSAAPILKIQRSGDGSSQFWPFLKNLGFKAFRYLTPALSFRSSLFSCWVRIRKLSNSVLTWVKMTIAVERIEKTRMEMELYP